MAGIKTSFVSTHSRLGSRTMGVALLVSLVAAAFVHAADAPPLKVCLVSGSIEYKSNESLADFQKYLETNYPARCSRAFLEGKDEDLFCDASAEEHETIVRQLNWPTALDARENLVGVLRVHALTGI